jgi:hypothetical protein
MATASAEEVLEIVRNAIMTHSSPSVDRSDAHGCKGQAAHFVVDNHVQFIAQEIAERLVEPALQMRVCRGCTLSGEFWVLYGGVKGCELCDGGEPVTAHLLFDLASRVPQPPKRVGSNPLLDLSKEFNVSYDAVVNYANAVKRQYRFPNVEYVPTVWEERAKAELDAFDPKWKFTRPRERIRMLMWNFVKLQGSECN